MNIRHLASMLVLGLSISATSQANVTPANEDGGGNSVYFDRHQISCGYQGMKSLRLFRPSHNQIAFDFHCRDIGESSTTSMYTPPNDDGGGNSIFLDRHAVDCQNKGLQFVHLYRPSHNQIAYHYKCGQQVLANITDHYTSPNDDGGGNSIFLDRHNLSCPNNKVLTYFRLFRPSGNTIEYHYKCGTPGIDTWQEMKINGLCIDGSHANPGDNVYLHNCHGGDNQKWHKNAQGLIQIKANPNLCIDVSQSQIFGFGAYEAKLSYCDMHSPYQQFTAHNGSGLTAVLNQHSYCLGKDLYSNDVEYNWCSSNSDDQISFHATNTLDNIDPVSYLSGILSTSAVSDLAAAFQIGDFEVVHIDIYGTSTVRGKIRNMNNGNPMGQLIDAAVKLRKYLVNDNRTDIPVVVNLTNQGNNNYQVEVRLEVVRGWREINFNNPFGTSTIIKDADLVLTATVEHGEVTKTIGVDGAIYIKPTNMDNWLYTNPSVVREIGEDPTTSYGLVIKGACPFKPDQNTNGQAYCVQDWNVLNAQILHANSEANGGYNFLQVNMVGSTPVGGKVVFNKGRFLNTANISGQWEGDEQNSKGRANIQLNGLQDKVVQVIDATAFGNLSDYSFGLLDPQAYQVREVYVTQEAIGQTRIHVIMDVLGERIHVIHTPQRNAQGNIETAQANEALLRAVAEAIGRVIANKTPLSMLTNLVTSGLDVIGIRGETEVVFNTAGQTLNSAGNLVDSAGNVINDTVDTFCDWTPFC